ncbi:Phosphoenolpyruvate carboxykinase (ATP) [Bacillus paralicheniformis]|nr:Phosphoenolpyruvate carboxykinase (ATP) [Bacillus paralicheniformis]
MGENVQLNLSVPLLVEKVLERKEGVLTSSGAVRATTGTYTGRSPKDKFIVEEASTKDKIDWGAVNQPISEAAFDRLYTKVLSYLKERDELYVFEGFAGADEKYRLPITVVNEFAWHNLFVSQLLNLQNS